MIKKKINGKWCIKMEENSDSQAKIGHLLSSETLFPEIFFNEKENISFCDCPGFLDTRGMEEKICISMNIQLAVEKALTIRCLIVVISYQELSSARGESFKNLIEILSKLFKEPSKLASSIIFIITKTSSEIDENDVRDEINSMREEIKKNLESIKDSFKLLLFKNKKEEGRLLENKSHIIQLMENQRVFTINVLDKGESRKKILKEISQIKQSINIESFNFDESDDERMKFNRYFVQKLYDYDRLMDKKKNFAYIY